MARGRIERAVWSELDPAVRPLGLAQAALACAARMDRPEVDDRDFAALKRELRASLVELRKLTPAPVEDSLAKRRARRAAGG